MSLDSAKAFYSDITSGKVKLDISKMVSGDPAAAMAYAHSHGYDFTEDEMLEALKHNGKSISMEQAEAVAGGDASTWTGASVGAAAGGAACA
jgi:predicted ribosomally synthesized peptide with nif11-like leader